MQDGNKNIFQKRTRLAAKLFGRPKECVDFWQKMQNLTFLGPRGLVVYTKI